MPLRLAAIYRRIFLGKSTFAINVTQVLGHCNGGGHDDLMGDWLCVQRAREQYVLLPHDLYFNDCIHWADLHAGPTLSAFILIYDIFLFTFSDGVCGALLGTRSTCHALIIDLIRHVTHLLTVRSPLFLSLLPQSLHRFVRRRYPLSFVPDAATDATHPRKYPSPSPSCAIVR